MDEQGNTPVGNSLATAGTNAIASGIGIGASLLALGVAGAIFWWTVKPEEPKRVARKGRR
jgi:hypothetical protein